MQKESIYKTYYDDNGNKHSETAYLYNTYPLYLKMHEDISKGIYLYQELEGIETIIEFSNMTKFVIKVNPSLTKFIKRVYLDNMNEVLGMMGDYEIISVKSNGFNLIFVRNAENIIFVNYFRDSINLNMIPSLLIPYDIPNNHIHIKEMPINNVQHVVINTFYAFTSFAEYRNFKPNLDLNEPFFKSFYISARLGNNINEWINEIDIKGRSTENWFKYALVGNVVIILDYEKILWPYYLITNR